MITIGEKTNTPFIKKLVLRCVCEKDLLKLLESLKLKKKDVKVRYELYQKGKDYHNVDWGGFPEFSQNPPHPELRFSFSTEKDLKDFYKNNLKKPFKKERGAWFPEKPRTYPLGSKWVTTNKKINKYPIFVISKGRFEKRPTSDWLEKYKIQHFLVVEECEVNKYKEHTLNNKFTTVINMEEKNNNLGQGSIPVRNWIDSYCLEGQYKKYWLLDDNMNGFYRYEKNTRLEMTSSTFFRICEEFSDRYKNLYLSGLQYFSFVPEIARNKGLCLKNTRIYSCMLIDIKLKDKLDGVLWRGRYNEDTDLSLRLLKKGFPTILHQQFLCNKATTLSCKGGNTDSIYKDDGLQRKCDSIVEQHPDVAKQTFKFGKIHHSINYKSFKNNSLIINKNKILPIAFDDWGLNII